MKSFLIVSSHIIKNSLQNNVYKYNHTYRWTHKRILLSTFLGKYCKLKRRPFFFFSFIIFFWEKTKTKNNLFSLIVKQIFPLIKNKYLQTNKILAYLSLHSLFYSLEKEKSNLLWLILFLFPKIKLFNFYFYILIQI